MMKEKEDLPSVVSGNTSTPEDATPCFSENEPAHNSSKNLNNGSPTTNPQPDYAHNSTPTPRPHASRATTDTPAPRPHASRATTDTPAPRPHPSRATTDTPFPSPHASFATTHPPTHTRAQEVVIESDNSPKVTRSDEVCILAKVSQDNGVRRLSIKVKVRQSARSLVILILIVRNGLLNVEAWYICFAEKKSDRREYVG